MNLLLERELLCYIFLHHLKVSHIYVCGGDDFLQYGMFFFWNAFVGMRGGVVTYCQDLPGWLGVVIHVQSIIPYPYLVGADSLVLSL